MIDLTDIRQAAILPHRSIVLARRPKENIQVWDLRTRKFSRELLLEGGPPLKCFFTSQGNRLIIGSLDGPDGPTLHEIDFSTWENIRNSRGQPCSPPVLFRLMRDGALFLARVVRA